MLTLDSELPVYKRFAFRPVRGRGCYLWDDGGRRILDMYGGHAVVLTGHAHTRFVEAVSSQAAALPYYSNVLPIDARDKVIERLARLAPEELDQVFLVNSGAEANEQALALARRATGRDAVIAIEGGFHGRTLATLAVSGIERYRTLAAASGGRSLLERTRVSPFCDVPALEELIDNDVAAVIIEPVQGLAGARDCSSEFLRRARALCDATGAALIFDEVQCGCGRCGAFTAAELYGVTPDALTLAKGIASGLPMGALLVNARLAEGVGVGDLGSTFGGAPLSCAAAAATLDTLVDEDLIARAAGLGRTIEIGAGSIASVERVRGRGLLLGLALDRPARPVQEALFESGILSGTSIDENTLRLLPPLVLEQQHVETFLGTLDEVLK